MVKIDLFPVLPILSAGTDGKETDENGKKWNSTMCFAWFVWEKGYSGDTIIKWI